MGKLFTAFAAAVLTLSFAVGLTACDKERVDGGVDGTQGLEYTEIKENNKITAYAVSGVGEASEEKLVIPSAYNGKPVAEIADGAFGGCDSIVSVTIPDSVKTIGEKAFYECSALEDVTVGSGVVYSGEYAFGRCVNLTSVYIKSLKSWCETDFANPAANPLYFADGLYVDGKLTTNLIVSDDTAYIGSYAFYDCSGIKSVVTGGGVTSIGGEAFYNCSGLESVTVGSGVKSIGGSAFQNCTALESLTLGGSVQTISDYAFSCCYLLDRVSVPASVKTIGECAFAECSSLTEINLEYGLESIGVGAFAGCSKLKGFAMPDSVTEIGFGMLMFGQNGGFESGELENVFSELVISNSLTEIPDYAFNGCNIKNLTIGKSVETIRYSAFYACSMLESVIIPVSLKKIESYAFYRCNMLYNVYYEGTADEWAKISIGKNGNELRNIFFYSETAPVEDGNYWHYVGGVPELW